MNKLSILTFLGLICFVIGGCEIEPSQLKPLWITKKKDGILVSKTFKPGDTVHVKATPRMFTGKVKIKSYMTAGEDYDDVKKDEKIPGTEQVLEINENEFATFSIELGEDYPIGKYNIAAEMINEEGKTLDTKTSEIEVSK